MVAKQKFNSLKIDREKTLLWGECSGSGKNPYYCSADFVEENNPVFRCDCPSRQFPCKHCLGLMFAYVQGLPFQTSDIPQDILDKRQKKEQRQEKKEQEKLTVKEQESRPKKVNTPAIIKKAETQLQGIEIARKILLNTTLNGLSSVDAKERKSMEAQVKELGNYYIPGVQSAFNHLLLEVAEVENEDYTPAINQINYLVALLQKATDHLNGRKENPEAPLEISSAIEEQIGHIWKLTELMQAGLYEEHAELLQLSFNCIDNPSRKEWVDEGAWINLKTGKIYKTKNYRPYKAAKYIKEENSIFEVVHLRELYIYPGDLNPRIRWEPEAKTDRESTLEDVALVHRHAEENYAELLKSAKSVIKNPLADKNPLALISLHNLFLHGEHLVAEDKEGNKLTISDIPGENPPSEKMLEMILPRNPVGMSLLVMINNDLQSGLLSARPLSLITGEHIVKLIY